MIAFLCGVVVGVLLSAAGVASLAIWVMRKGVGI